MKRGHEAMRDYYALLGVSAEATAAEIKSAYRRRMLAAHPDLNGAARAAEERARELNEAYEVLGDPARRARYDALRAERRHAVGDTWPGGRRTAPAEAKRGAEAGGILLGLGLGLGLFALLGGAAAALLSKGRIPSPPPPGT